MSSYNFASVGDTMQAVRAQRFPHIQAEESTSNFFERLGIHEPKGSEVFRLVADRFFIEPKWEPLESEFRQLLQIHSLRIRESTLCWSSKWMSELMNWRNVQTNPIVLRPIVNITKILVTEVALPFLTVTAAIETVATKIVLLGAQALKPLSTRPLDYEISIEHKSALFTTLWTTSTLWHNIIQSTLPVTEGKARQELFRGYFAPAAHD